jgi:transposase
MVPARPLDPVRATRMNGYGFMKVSLTVWLSGVSTASRSSSLAPHNKITGGRLLSSATLPSANRAAGILRMAAMSLGRTETALGAFYRRLAFRVGKAKAITATARKLAILVYRTLKDGLVYRDPGAAAYDAQHRQRVIRRLRQRAAKLGLALVNRETGELLDGAVS